METKTRKNMKWYIVRTQGNHERSLMEKLKSDKTVEKVLGDVMVPTEYIFYVKNGKKVKREKVLYPGYVFVETNNTGEVAAFLKETSSGGFLRERNGDIKPMRKREINNLIGQQENKEEVEEMDLFIVGEKIEIIDGPFKSMVGVVNSIRGEKVNINVSIFGRETNMDLNVNQITKKQ